MRIFEILIKLLVQVSRRILGEYSVYKAYRFFLGVSFGKNVRILGKVDFGSEPYLIEIGDNVTITHGVHFITHDGGAGIFRKEYPGINVFGRISIHNNVFIGNNTFILPNVTIGSNVVIGTASVVTKNIPDNVIVAGVPAKIIRTLDEYKTRCLKKAIFITENNLWKRKQQINNELGKLV